MWSSKEAEVGSPSFASGVEVLCLYSIFLCCLLVCDSVMQCALPIIELLGLFFHFGIRFSVALSVFSLRDSISNYCVCVFILGFHSLLSKFRVFKICNAMFLCILQ